MSLGGGRHQATNDAVNAAIADVSLTAVLCVSVCANITAVLCVCVNITAVLVCVC